MRQVLHGSARTTEAVRRAVQHSQESLRTLPTILDDFSRYIIAWKLCSTMKASDVADTLQLALTASGCEHAQVRRKPRLLSDNGSSYISGDLATWLDDRKMTHVRSAPYHPGPKAR